MDQYGQDMDKSDNGLDALSAVKPPDSSVAGGTDKKDKKKKKKKDKGEKKLKIDEIEDIDEDDDDNIDNAI